MHRRIELLQHFSTGRCLFTLNTPAGTRSEYRIHFSTFFSLRHCFQLAFFCI
uniref:Uncharacterized protein n=1 Tax=Arundo donax TaxID=35708 RepID=A0A0A8ZJL5_ARUDO